MFLTIIVGISFGIYLFIYPRTKIKCKKEILFLNWEISKRVITEAMISSWTPKIVNKKNVILKIVADNYKSCVFVTNINRS